MNNLLILHTTGETALIVHTAAQTQGAYVEFITTLPTDGVGPPPHIHPYQDEHFEVMEGKLGLLVKGEKLVLEPGQQHTVPRNTVHTFYNAGDTGIKWRVIFKPALHSEWMAREMIASANRNRSKLGSFVEFAYILSQLKGEYYLANVPRIVQQVIFPVVGWMGKLTGVAKSVSSKSSVRH